MRYNDTPPNSGTFSATEKVDKKMYVPICDGIFQVPLWPKKSGQFFCLGTMKRTKKEPSEIAAMLIITILTYLPKKPRTTFTPIGGILFNLWEFQGNILYQILA